MRLPPTKLPFPIKWNRKNTILVGAIAVLILLLVVGVARCQTALTDDEKAAIQFFEKVFVETDVQAAKRMVASESKNNPRVNAGIEVGADIAKEEQPIDSGQIQIATLEEMHKGNFIVLYHPEKTLFLVVKETKIKGFEQIEIDWDALQDELEREYPDTPVWKEATIH